MFEHNGIIRWGQNRVNVAVGSSASAGTALPSGSFLEVRATVDCYIAFGSSGAVAAVADNTSHLFLRGAQSIIVPYNYTDPENPVPYTHFSVLQAGDDAGVIQISQLR